MFVGGFACVRVRSTMFQGVGGLDSDQLLQQRAGTAPRPWAGKKCDISVPSASPGGEVVILSVHPCSFCLPAPPSCQGALESIRTPPPAGWRILVRQI
eukprot:scaffold28738_cov34-Phaeocystis_antarctica.AAC.2